MSATEEVAEVGDAQRFECQVVGFPTPSITWFKDDVDITADPRYNIGFDKDRGVITLTIYKVLPSDEGCYQCKAENTEGKATTTSYLVVRVDHGLSRGFQSMLVSERTSEQEMSQVQMASSDKQRVFEEVITRVEETEKEVIEEKLIPPKISYDRSLEEGLQLKSGATLYIEVGVTGIPQPEVTWQHNEKKVEESAQVTMESDKGWAYMKVKGSTTEASGTYKVTAENSVGKDEAAFNVKVKAPPSCPRNLRVIEVYKDFITIAWDEPETDGGDKIQAYNIEKSLGGGMFVSVAQAAADEREMKITRLYEGSEYLFRVSAMNKTGVSPPAGLDKPVKARLPFDPPGTPRNLRVTDVNKDYAVLAWEAPETDGGALITQYIIEKKDTTRITGMWAIAGTVEGTKYEYKVDKLFTGNSYLFRVYAENRVGPGEPATTADSVVAKLPYDKPMPPRKIRAVETSIDYIVIEWDEPESDGGSPITGYVIEKRDSKRREYIYITDVGADVRSYKATRLFEGYEYYFRVMAENIVGPSAPCELEKPVKAKLPYDEPLAPRNLQVKDYWTDFVTVCWEAPESDGGSPLTGYIIEKRDANRATWVKAGNVGPDADTYKVSNLFEGTDYVFRVFAENKVGPSLKAAELEKPVRAKMPFDPPFAPLNLKATDVDRDCCTLIWEAPANDGGAPIERYVIEQRDAMRSTWSRCGTTETTVMTLKVEDLIEGDSYFFRVSAENKVGRGQYDELTHPVKAKLPYDKPQPPTKLRTKEIWSTHITLAWDAPTDDGGSPIISYNVEVRDAHTTGFKSVASVDAKNTTFKVPDLEEGHEYYFRVYAVNAAGSSTKSAELKPAVKAKLPFTAPTSPRNVKVDSVTVDSLTISWESPENDGGTKLLGYIIEIQEGDGKFTQATTVDGFTFTVTIKDLKEGVTYNIQVFAENAQGRSKPETLAQPVKTKTAEKPAEVKPTEVKPAEEKPVEAKPAEKPTEAKPEEPAKAGPPSAPKSLCVTEAQPDAVTIAWEAPVSDGGSPVTNYVVVYKDVESSKKFRKAGRVDANTFTLTITDKIKKGHEYLMVVYAENEHGVSADGAELATPFRIPDKRTTVAQEEKVTIEAAAPAAAAPAPEEKKPEEKKPEEKKPEEEKPKEKEPEKKPVEEKPVVEEAVAPVAQAPVEAAKPEKKVPDAPRNVKVSDVTAESFTVTWDEPETDGGAEITQYTIVLRDMEKKKFKAAGTVDGKTRVFKVTKIKENHEYIVRIYAENVAGLSTEGELDEPVKAVSPTDEPDTAKKPGPEILTAPEPVAIKEGETIRLTAKVKGDPEPDVTWHRGDTEVKKSKRDRRIKTDWDIKEDIYSLLISDATKEDSGDYTVRATNENGSFTYTVTVLVGIPEGAQIVETTRKTTSVHETIIDGEVVERIEKEDTKVEKADDVVETKKEVVEEVVQQEEVKEVKAAKPKEDTKSPKIEVPPEPVEVDVGETIKLSCKVTGEPSPEVIWLKEDTPLSNDFDTRIEVECDDDNNLYILIIHNAEVEDSGEYKIKADNIHGSMSVTVRVVVKGRPKEAPKAPAAEKFTSPDAAGPGAPEIIIPPSSVCVDAGQPIFLFSQVAGDPRPEVEWFRGDEQLLTGQPDSRVNVEYDAPEDMNFMEITDSRVEDSGEYTMVVFNDKGGLSIAVKAMVFKPITKVPERKSSLSSVSSETSRTLEKSDSITSMDESSTVSKKSTTRIEESVSVTGKQIKKESSEEISETTVVTKKETFAEESVKGEVSEEVVTVEESSVVESKMVKATEGPGPKIEMAPEPVSITEGEVIKLTCRVSGTPEPTLKWYKDDQQVQPNTDSRVRMDTDVKEDLKVMIIDKATRDDEGTYRLEVTNDSGSVSLNVMVTVDEGRREPKEPKIEIAPEPVEFTEGETITLKCKVSGYPLPEFIWSRDNEQISLSDTRVSITWDEATSEAVMSIENATRCDAGAYKFEAVNDQGSTAVTVMVTVDLTGVPQIEVPPEPVTCFVGETITLSTRVTGDPDPDINWYKDGKLIKPRRTDQRIKTTWDMKEDLTVLTIKDATKADEGSYRMEAINERGTVSVNVTVNVDKKEKKAKKPEAAPEAAPEAVEVVEEVKAQVAEAAAVKPPMPPTIEKVPEPVIVQEGDTIWLSCRIKGRHKPPDVRWVRCDRTIFPRRESIDRLKADWDDDMFSLRIRDIKKGDEGEYKVEASDEGGTAEASIRVEIADTHPEEEPEEASPPQEAIDTTDSFQVSTEEHIVLETQSAPPPQPQIHMDIDTLDIMEGESIRLTCTVSADQEAEVSWLKDDKKLKKKQKKDPRIKIDHDVKQDLYILEITESTVEDSGKYVVSATNAQGTVTHTVEVTVKAQVVEGMPRFGKLPEPVSVHEGEEIRITCEIFGSPQPEVSWFHGGQPIKPDNRITITVDGDDFTLVIEDATLNDDGEFSVTAVNSLGKIFHSIKVTVEAKVTEAAKPAGKAPEFVKKPGALTANEFDPIKIQAVITGSPSVTWFKEGKPLKNAAVKTSSSGDLFTLTIPSASFLDAGEYTITANNDAGGTFHTVNLTVEAATEKEDTEKEEEDKDMAVVEKLLPKITAEKEKLKEEDEMLLKKSTGHQEYPCLDDYKDNVRGVELKKDDIVEVLDTEKDDEWLVRLQAEKEKVCYVPVELLLGKKEKKKGRLSRSPSKKEESSEEEELTDKAEAIPVFQAIADYNPPEDAKDHLTLKEGQFVDVLDQNNPERWLCRTKPTKNTSPKQGWVPPSYLEARRGSGQADTRTSREVFREDVLQLDNKEQEAAMKRRYALTDLWESERDYIRDVGFAMDTYYPKFDGDLPDSLKGKKDFVFSTFPTIRTFHADQFLADLLKCSPNANSVGQCFLDHTEDFQLYVPYYMGREQVEYVLNLEEPQKFIKDHDKAIGNVGESKLSLPQYLARPVERIDEYISILRDFMKYSSRAGEEVDKADNAIKMLLELRRRAEDENALSRITGYPGDLSDLGPILRHDDFIVWDTEPTGKGKERHLFLFDNKLMLTKKKKPKNPGDPTTYEFKGIIDLPDIQMNEHLEDERRFELWYPDPKTEKFTFQARNVHIKQAWCDDIRRCMRKLGYMTAEGEESDISSYQSALEDEGTEPAFSAKLKPINCSEGEPIRFVCQITGLPAPDVSWYRDGQKIKQNADFKFEMDGDKYILFMPKASKEFTGKYTIKATNKNGTIESSADLTVELANMAPSFKSKLKDVETKLGSQARFEVKIASLPEAEVVWYHNGEEVKSGDRFKFLFEDEETFVLIIENIMVGDEGTYKIKASNSLGKKSCSANLTIRDLEDKLKWKAPKFTSTLKDVNATEGSKAKMSCKLSGYPEPEITWLKDGEVLKPDSAYKMAFADGTASLTIKSVTMEHTGKYTCRITNSSGTCDSSAKLLVDVKEPGKSKVKPKFTKKISDVDALKGEKTEFKCELEGLPLPDITWFHNKKALVETDRIKIYKLEGEHTLVLSSTLKTDAGEYTCKAINSSGEVSCSAQLYVTEDTLKESDSMEMSYAPSFTKKISNQQVPLGTLAQFHCKSIGVPDPEVTWMKDDKPIEANDHVTIDRENNLFSLMINNTELEDAGTYECIITNTAGSNKCSAQLIIEKPKPKEPLRSSVERSTDKNIKPPIMPVDKPYLTNIDVNNFNLSWLPAILPPKSKPTPIFYVLERCQLPGSEWVVINTDLTDTTCHVGDFDPLKDYMYRAKAFNSAGESDPTNTLSVLAKALDPSLAKKEPVRDKLPPRPVRDKPVVFDITHDSLKLSWQPSEIPSYAVQTPITYVVERRCPPSKKWIEVAMDLKDTTWTMTDYKPQKDYMFRIRAQNEFGMSDPSMSATLFSTPVEEEKTKKKAPVEEQKSKCKPRTVWDKPELFDISDTSCKLRWKPSSLPNYAEQTPIFYIVEKREPPNSDWIRIATEVEDTTYEVRKITRKRDYYFRIRATNQYGTSEPSMPAMLRKVEEVDLNLEQEKKKKKQKEAEDNIPTKRVPLHMRVIPEFLGQTDEVQYGVDGRTAKIVTYLRAYPEPTIMWFFNSEKITFGEKYCSTLSAQGELILEIERFSWSDVGDYKVYIENEFGSASLIIKMDMADPPTFLEPMRDQVFNLRMDGKLECRVHGIPYPTVQFKHDWRVIADGHRVKISREDYDHWTLNVRNSIYMDEGNYECVAENLAGKVYCTAAIKVNEKAGLRDIRFNPVPLEDYFHIIDELGRGAYGVVRRVIDKNSGNQYAAKFLRFPDHLVKSELETELEILTLLDHTGIIQVIDGYEDKKRLVIVMEIVTGGELLPRLIRQNALTESEVAFYIRQLLLIVEYMHCKNVVHLDLKPENLFLASHGSDELKLIDFGFARRYNPRLGLRVKYATPEFCAPEVAKNEDVTSAADMWSVGVITYILMSGISPFHKDSARDTLLKVKSGEWSFDKEMFANISKEAKDFITQCLTINPKKRMTATAGVDHAFIELAHHRGLGDRISLEKLRGYSFRRKWERGLQSVKTFAQPKPLSSYMSEMPIVEAPSLEVEVDVPILDLPGAPTLGLPTLGAVGGAAAGPGSDTASVGSGQSLTVEAGAAGMLQVMGPPSLLSGAPSTIGSGGSSEWGREYEDEDTWYEWSSSYQTGPDTFLLPKSDSGLSLRMAKYRRSGGKKGMSAGDVSVRTSMRERRDLRDLEKDAAMQEDSLIRHTGKKSVWQLKAMIDNGGTMEVFPPIFKEKIRDKAYNVGDSCTLHVHVIGNPMPAVSWYRNDELLTDGGRVRTSHTEDGRHSLTVLSTKPNDFGVYKCVARNKHGKVTCRARMLLGDIPGRPGRPHVTKVSEREIYMIWEEPENDGNSYILAYRVDWHRPGDERWTTATYSIDECALVKGLQPETTYRFRIAALNRFGVSPYSWASVEIRTRGKGTGAIDIDEETKRILLRSRQAQSRPSPDPSPVASPAGSMEDLSKLADDKDPGFLEREVFLQEKTDPHKYLNFGSEVWRGRYTLVRNVKPKEGKKAKRIAKIIPYDPKNPEESLREYEMLKNVRQEHVVRLYEAFQNEDAVVLVFEKLFGENVARSLSLKNRYSEHAVTGIIKQVLDALQFLHHRGIVHLNLQPDNVIMVSRRRFDIKLIDFGRARKITTYEGEKVDRYGTAEFMAPEKVARENVGVPADIWGVGVLAFILLSGVSPFQGETDEDVYANVKSVRYDAHQIYHNVTKYALKFIYQTLKRNTKARLTTEECLEHRWLMLNSQMIKMRKSAIFPTERLRLFEEDYIRRRMSGGGPSSALMSVYGKQDVFSDSEDELFGGTD